MARPTGGGLFGKPDALFVDEEAPRISMPSPPPLAMRSSLGDWAIEPSAADRDDDTEEADSVDAAAGPLRLFIGTSRVREPAPSPSVDEVFDLSGAFSGRADAPGKPTPAREEAFEPRATTPEEGPGTSNQLPPGSLLPSEMGDLFGLADPDEPALGSAAPEEASPIRLRPPPMGPRVTMLRGSSLSIGATSSRTPQPVFDPNDLELSDPVGVPPPARDATPRPPRASAPSTPRSTDDWHGVEAPEADPFVTPWQDDPETARANAAPRPSIAPNALDTRPTEPRKSMGPPTVSLRATLPATSISVSNRRTEMYPTERKSYVPLKVRPQNQVSRLALIVAGTLVIVCAAAAIGYGLSDLRGSPVYMPAPHPSTPDPIAVVPDAIAPPPVDPAGAVEPVVEAPPVVVAPPVVATRPAPAPVSASPVATRAPGAVPSGPAAYRPSYAETGLLRIVCDERAQIFIDGKKRGWSNELPPLEMSVGTHKVKAMVGGRARVMDARVDSGTMREVQFRFRQ